MTSSNLKEQLHSTNIFPDINLQPLEETVPELFQKAAYIKKDEAISLIHQYTGMIPVSITPDHKVVWLDVGNYPFKEWKFRYSIKNLVDNFGLGKCFSADISLLANDDILVNNLVPTGFVFHMSKCGSTLMSKALAQPHSHISVSEATPLHENLWQYLTNNWQQPVALTDSNLRLIRNLILAMGRRRLPEQQYYFVKFRSWNVLFAEAIQKAFPEVPCLFMYREPKEVLVSSLSKSAVGQTRLKEYGAASFIMEQSAEAINKMSELDYFACLYEQYIKFGLEKLNGQVSYLNYKQMTKANFANILKEAFGYVASDIHLHLMQSQFDVYSKDDTGSTRFFVDSHEKQKQVTPEVREIANRYLMAGYQQLEQLPGNLNQLLT